MTLRELSSLPAQRIIPNLVVSDIDAAVKFYEKVFQSEVILQNTLPGGSISQVRLRIGNSLFVVSEQRTNVEVRTPSPSSLECKSVWLELIVDDLDAALERASDAGGKVSFTSDAKPCIGDRVCEVTDPFGHIWRLSMFIDDGGALCI